MKSREAHLVELVDDTGRVLGETTVAAAHQAPGRLHRAFSVLLVDPDGRVLLQQRAPVKTRFPLRWANSCCGHPLPAESLAEAANRRLAEELGAGPVSLTEVGVYLYYAEDPATGRVEFEYDHVLRADVPAALTLRPDPDEVAELRWVDPTRLMTEIDADPRPYAPWLGGVVSRLLRPAPTTTGPDAPAVADPNAPAGGPEAPAGGPAAGSAIPSGRRVDDASERSGGR
ncbi:isopentenyl-diphosphate Delta-isomerase [Micromonospora antibiotica]|uniref:Isopentenyl-diphosphate Delta-isomerase n=1 Tax=Micromonospora antibiotica TaxID=2807623 RepID=A0ABS3V263_9ACTN|nr:isopentenyl-diphosphate Delta-isomerase [Micromonospora antibiotica]MBO4159689.1 isopentenyl-diphosphate Delta-isomerase [Micromonospora antibiotica]